jgi:transglutaminase-like putative cysteine protease
MNAFFLFTYFLVGLALISLLMAEIIGLPVFLLMAFLVACSAARKRLGLNFSRTVVNTVVLIISGGLLFMLFTAGGFYIRYLLYFSLVLLMAKLYSPKAYRDHVQIFLICTFYLIAATMTVATMAFLFLFLAYLATGLAYLVLVNMRRDAEWCTAGATPAKTTVETEFTLPHELRHLLGRPFAWTLGMIFILVLVLSTTGFFLIPRFTANVFRPSMNHPADVETGFSETVELGAIGDIQVNNRPVMKVFVEGQRPESRIGVRWRGVTLDEFDGTSWQVSKAMRRRDEYALPRTRGGIKPGFRLSEDFIPNVRLRFEVQPVNTRMVFHIPDVVSLKILEAPLGNLIGLPAIGSLRLEPLAGNKYFSPVDKWYYVQSKRVWDSKNTPSDNPSGFHEKLPRGNAGLDGPVIYRLACRVEKAEAEQLRAASGNDPDIVRDFYLPLPGGMKRIEELARTITQGETTRYDRAVAIEQYLRLNYGYSLQATPGSRGRSLEDFLFEDQQGHCEYFAAAMGVLLRTLGIPARVANGFNSGEFNRLQDFYLVRQSDAHSWVEVFFPGHGWVPFDPTPPVNRGGLQLLRTLREVKDAIELAWLKYVVDYSFHEQRQLFRFLYHTTGGMPDLPNLTLNMRSISPQNRPWLVLLAKVLFILLAVFFTVRLILRRVVRGRPPRKQSGRRRLDSRQRTAIAFYQRLLKILARKGFKRKPGQTPGELAESIAARDKVLGGMIHQVTSLYYEARFGGATLQPEALETTRRTLKEVKRYRLSEKTAR